MHDVYAITYSCPRKAWCHGEIIDAMVEDMLHGQTFRILPSRQETVHLRRAGLCGHVQKLDTRRDRQWFTVRVPARHFDSGRLSACMVQLWGNILDYRGVRLEEFDPRLLLGSRPKRTLQVADAFASHRYPLIATVMKPPWALSLKKRVDMATEFVTLGGDLVKEDETYAPSLAQLVSEVARVQGALDALGARTRGLGLYVPNITCWVNDAAAIERLVKAGMRAGLISFLAAGFDTVRDMAMGPASGCFLWGHRVGYGSMRSTFSMTALAQLAFASGLDGVHVGTPILNRSTAVTETAGAVRTIRMLSARSEASVLPIFSKTSRPIIGGLVEHYGRQAIFIGCGELFINGQDAWDRVRLVAWLREGYAKKKRQLNER
jgi:ribulose 1,5-bisphosphate carboxylase large subunit-like protein